jgi:hypothetical protein
MRDKQRIQTVIGALQECWECMPDLRFGQMIMNIVLSHKGNENTSSYLWNMEEQEWLKAIQSFHENNKDKWIGPSK